MINKAPADFRFLVTCAMNHAGATLPAIAVICTMLFLAPANCVAAAASPADEIRTLWPRTDLAAFEKKLGELERTHPHDLVLQLVAVDYWHYWKWDCGRARTAVNRALRLGHASVLRKNIELRIALVKRARLLESLAPIIQALPQGKGTRWKSDVARATHQPDVPGDRLLRLYLRRGVIGPNVVVKDIAGTVKRFYGLWDRGAHDECRALLADMEINEYSAFVYHMLQYGLAAFHERDFERAFNHIFAADMEATQWAEGSAGWRKTVNFQSTMLYTLMRRETLRHGDLAQMKKSIREFYSSERTRSSAVPMLDAVISIYLDLLNSHPWEAMEKDLKTEFGHSE